MEIPLSLVRLDASGRKPAAGAEAAALRYGIPLWYRLVSCSIAGILVAANALASLEPGYRLSAFGIVLVLAAVLAAVYEERWTFRAADRSVAGKLGLVFAAKRLRFSFEDVARVKVDSFIKGRLDQSAVPPADKVPRGSLARMIIEMKDGQGYLVDSVPFKARERLEDAAAAIAAMVGVPLD